MTGKLGCIADDLTGGSDLAGVLVAAGMRTVQTIGVPRRPVAGDCDAIVVSLKSRMAPAADAVADSLAALDYLRQAGCDHIYFKYCSTFDSTPAGNIGPVLDALHEACSAPFSIACPAFPATGRTVYQGHLFVGDRLLSDSGMESHPVTPMSDADLVRVLQAQTMTRVGLIPLADIHADRVAATADALVADGVGYAIGDAIEPSDLATLGRWCATMPLSSGASGLAEGIARAMTGGSAASAPAALPRLSGPRIVLSGSCSRMTRRQVANMVSRRPSFRIALEEGSTPERISAAAKVFFDERVDDGPILFYSTADPDEVARQRGIDPNVSAVFEEILADVAAYVVAQGARALVIAGGETSGAVVQRLSVEQLSIGPEIDPGVPWTIGRRDGDDVLLALKSGNFGSESFLLDAWEMLP